MIRIFASGFAIATLFASSVALFAQSPAAHLTLLPQESTTDQLLIGLSPVSADVVWASGAGGTVVRTLDGGTNWKAMVVPGADTVQFRDIHGVDAEIAYVLSAGTGSASRIYKTLDGGVNWSLQFTNELSLGFLDCMDFWDPLTGVVFGDQVDNVFEMIRTDDGGATWTRLEAEMLPPASDGEGSFAASGRCLITVGDRTGYVGTGAGAAARLLKTTDRGKSWTAFDTPINDGTPTSGISSLSFIDEQHGFAFGVELAGDDSLIQNAAETRDGGVTWTLLTPPQLPDVYGGTHVPGRSPLVLVAVGPKGIDLSTDAGHSWISASKLDHWGVAFADSETGWAVGPGGRITKLELSGR